MSFSLPSSLLRTSAASHPLGSRSVYSNGDVQEWHIGDYGAIYYDGFREHENGLEHKAIRGIRRRFAPHVLSTRRVDWSLEHISTKDYFNATTRGPLSVLGSMGSPTAGLDPRSELPTDPTALSGASVGRTSVATRIS